MTPPEIVDELLANKVINPNPHGYLLGVKGGDYLNNDQPLSAINLQPGAQIRVIPATDAGHISIR